MKKFCKNIYKKLILAVMMCAMFWSSAIPVHAGIKEDADKAQELGEQASQLQDSLIAKYGIEGYKRMMEIYSASLHGNTSSSTKKASCSHEYTEGVVSEPTCIKKGYTKYTCSKCGDEYTEEIAATGTHDYEVTVLTNATCDKSGSSMSTCKYCGKTIYTIIPAKGHSYTTEIVDATCTENGKLIHTCDVCGDTYTEETEATGHTPSEFKTIIEPTAFKNGVKANVCEVCGVRLNEEVIPSQYPVWIIYVMVGALIISTTLMMVGIIKYIRSVKTIKVQTV